MLHLGRFTLDIRTFFTVRVVKSWNQIPSQVGNTLSLLVFKRHLDNALYRMLYLGQLRIGQAAGFDDCCRSLPTEIVCSMLFHIKNTNAYLHRILAQGLFPTPGNNCTLLSHLQLQDLNMRARMHHLTCAPLL